MKRRSEEEESFKNLKKLLAGFKKDSHLCSPKTNGTKKTKQRKADLKLKRERKRQKKGAKKSFKKFKKTSCTIQKRFSPLQSQNKGNKIAKRRKAGSSKK